MIVVDTETTGANLFEHDLLSYAFAPVCFDSVLEGFVDYPVASKWSEVAKSYFANFEEEWSKYRKSSRLAVAEIEDYLERISPGGEMVMVGHNVAFDRFFLEKLANNAGQSSIRGLSHRTVDTHSMLMTLSIMGKIPESATSSSGAFKYFNISPQEKCRHTALGDALATKDLFKLILAEFGMRSDMF
ncbi:hypothetical protein [Xanthomonas oryzae]|uniref:3'-5' exonuclease n=1 Tax=Xanthomonas oryzae TaxID=347 RepID=UPI00102EDCFA|nr:hypothetical protein [Xanthomonas oryzae]QBI11308.1 hypothetical protein EYR02_03120 [Xanthomonas oryzae pv. oryzae]QBI14868.1 hypothetical protein EYR03_02835 [Xanthomonas oryzae pv. oryzae]TAO90572.1 hypothetical protein EYR05_02835 [Xanthomonas oryzae pv. oryzae]TAP10613.1 hypothetical protein EYR04_02825 [Xanthomonas oryzae pv. oryzae]TAP15538.1 hypothetical protein EYR01_22930 [Xanthomonas oryzae pv. oryzae]